MEAKGPLDGDPVVSLGTGGTLKFHPIYSRVYTQGCLSITTQEEAACSF